MLCQDYPRARPGQFLQTYEPEALQEGFSCREARRRSARQIAISFRSFHNKSAFIGVEDAADLRFANWLLKTMGEHFTLHAREGFSD